MQKQYIAIYNCKDYSEQDLMDMIEVYKVRYWHRRQTWESPEEEDIDYKFDIDSNFDKAVKIACIEFKDDYDEYGQYVEFDDMKLKIYREGYSWLDLIQSFGWDTFKECEDFGDSEMEVRAFLDNWIMNIAKDKAWEVVENGEARPWYS